MSTSAVTGTDDKTQDVGFEMQRTAWLVVGLSFAAFCMICAGVSFGTHYYLYRSTIPMNSLVEVTRGSVGLVRTDLSEGFEREAQALSRGGRVTTDSQSQAVISFRDGRLLGEVAASVTVKNNSALTVRNTLQPRHDRSQLGYSASLTNIEGELDVFIPLETPRDMVLTLFMDGGVVVDISESGWYTVSTDGGVVELSTWEGQAAILPPNRNSSRPVVNGQVGTYDLETQTLRVEQKYVNLVRDSSFRQFDPEESADVVRTLPIPGTWNCSDRTLNAPMGMYERVFFDGRETLRIFRGANTNTHGETICVQPFIGQNGRIGQPVDDYTSLEVRTTFHIQSHSLDVCGVAGSECPLMLLMDYVDENGQSVQWFHGFYVKSDSRGDYPLKCLSCSQDHKQINDQTWYTYESGNLFALLPEGARPASVLNIRFYASGHDYEVFVSDVSLLASPPLAQGEPVAAS